MDKESLPLNLPEELKEILKEFSFEVNNIGCSRAKVFKLFNDEKSLYLKINESSSIFDLEKEKIILEWVSQKLEVPEVIYFGKENDTAFLLISEIEGKVSHLTESDKEKRRNVKILAEGLKKIHSISTAACPIDYSTEKLLQKAKERMEKGNINSDDFDERWSDRSPEVLFEEVKKLKPTDFDPVFSHGDYCLPNILIKEGILGGFIDWSWGGVNDRYFDLASVIWSIGYNYGEEWVKYFLEDYGIENMDWNRLKFFQKLNEFFQQ
ncbi:MAG: aminoglycoside 3'-phosphotransferase [Candidatus Heimdallarchaeota archaeon]|nr:aminoglycoside 3'-phosphotransferase [Candidatus Heimdallarchaeota archaeon]MCK5142625.1 aminoglycoside 3'-phosphotransferase [Candidatus Heimdallarchaeota archaeon]